MARTYRAGRVVVLSTTRVRRQVNVVRDQEEDQRVCHRIDQARGDRLLAEHDPFKSVS
jgi:hypothetical protein